MPVGASKATNFQLEHENDVGHHYSSDLQIELSLTDSNATKLVALISIQADVAKFTENTKLRSTLKRPMAENFHRQATTPLAISLA